MFGTTVAQKQYVNSAIALAAQFAYIDIGRQRRSAAAPK